MCFAQLSQAGDESAIQTALNTAADAVINSGYSRPLVAVTSRDVPQLINGVLLHTVVLSLKAEMDQFLSGLNEVRVGQMIQRCPDMFRPYFVATRSQLSAGKPFS